VTAAARMAKTRARRKAGKIPVTMLVDEDTVEDLVQAKLLDPTHTDDKPAIASALERLLTTLRATP
jgi:hypothetical protein